MSIELTEYTDRELIVKLATRVTNLENYIQDQDRRITQLEGLVDGLLLDRNPESAPARVIAFPMKPRGDA
ncbi:MAG: hypothetical protein KF767_18115 [Bdellovibrionaceae bacterium]|nr:hypothetical protein [Pseudobdellovibrionaceae bacterium]